MATLRDIVYENVREESFIKSSTISASAVLPVAIAVPSLTDGLGFVRSALTGAASCMCLGAMSVASSVIP